MQIMAYNYCSRHYLKIDVGITWTADLFLTWAV
jgi:hypothetical protein